MGRINSRKKGARGEKKAIEVLKAWTGMEFHRVPASGGLRWGKTENITGDIVCGDKHKRFEFSIEVKNYKDINFEHLIMPQVKSTILDEFWPQCLADGVRGEKLPLLMMRYDNIKPADFFFIGLLKRDFKRLKPFLKKGYPYMIHKRGLVLMASNMLFEADYTKVDKMAKQIIEELWK